MTLTIELPESVADRAALWSKEALSEVAVNAVVRRLLDETDGAEPLGEFGDVTEEIPMDEATFAALQEARADYDAGRYCTTDELRSFIMASLSDWEVKRNTAK